MSPEARRAFEAEWSVLSRRLRLLLVRKRVQPSLHDDLVQETAVRLLSMWDSVDRRRPLWPLTVTIALNVLRDQGRARQRDHPVAEVPELQSVSDVEAAGLARVELDRVLRAMDELSGSQRSALLKEVGAHAGANAPDASGDKMRRMRARRKLRLALEKVSGLVTLRLRRVSELMEGALAVKEGTASAASCAFCLMMGIGAAIAPPAGLTPPATAGPVETVEASATYSSVKATASARIDAAAEPRPGHRASADRRSAGTAAERRGKPGGKTKTKSKSNGGGSVTEDDPDPLGGLPDGGGDQPVIPPSSDVGTDLPTADPPSPPGGIPDSDVTSDPRPPTPAKPTPSHEPVRGGVLLLAPIHEEVRRLR